MWGKVTKDVGEARERELTAKFFKQAIDKGAQLARHQNTTQSAHDIIRRIMKNQPIVLQIQRELVDECKDIINTAAGDAVCKDIKEQIKCCQAEMKAVREDLLQAFKDNDEETRKEMEEEARRLQGQMDRMRKNLTEGVASNYQEEKRRMEEVMKEMQERARREKEQADAEYRRQMEALHKRLEDGANATAAQRAEPQKRIDHPQHQFHYESSTKSRPSQKPVPPITIACVTTVLIKNPVLKIDIALWGQQEAARQR